MMPERRADHYGEAGRRRARRAARFGRRRGCGRRRRGPMVGAEREVAVRALWRPNSSSISRLEELVRPVAARSFTMTPAKIARRTRRMRKTRLAERGLVPLEPLPEELARRLPLDRRSRATGSEGHSRLRCDRRHAVVPLGHTPESHSASARQKASTQTFNPVGASSLPPVPGERGDRRRDARSSSRRSRIRFARGARRSPAGSRRSRRRGSAARRFPRWGKFQPLERIGAGDYFHDLLGDLLVGARFMSSVSRSISSPAFSTRSASRSDGRRLRRRRLEQGPVDGRLEIGGKQAPEDLLGLRLVDESPSRATAARSSPPLLEQATAGSGAPSDRLDVPVQRRNVAIVDDDDPVILAVDQEVGEPLRDR